MLYCERIILMKKFEKEICKKQKETLELFGINCSNWTVQEASLAIKRIKENDGRLPVGITKDNIKNIIKNDYELEHPINSKDGKITPFSRGIALENIEHDGTWTVVDSTVVDSVEYEDRTFYEMENDKYGYIEDDKKIVLGHIIVDEDGKIISYFSNCCDNFLASVEFRTCDECGNVFIEGYFVDYSGLGSYDYYCSEECLYKHHTEEEYQELCDEDSAFWTQLY